MQAQNIPRTKINKKVTTLLFFIISKKVRGSFFFFLMLGLKTRQAFSSKVQNVNRATYYQGRRNERREWGGA